MENWDAGKKRRYPKRRQNEFRQEEGGPKTTVRTNLLWSIKGRKGTLLRVKQQQKVIHFKGERKIAGSEKKTASPNVKMEI